MAESETREKIKDHRRAAMLRAAGEDGYLKDILANGQRPKVERIIGDMVRDEADSVALYHDDTVVKIIKNRLAGRDQETDTPSAPSRG